MRRIFAAAFALAAVIATAPAQAADTFKIDETHADVVFAVSHLGFSDTWGRFNTVSGTIVMNEADVGSSKVEVLIDAASVDTNHAKRDEHLRAPDFFNVKEFPEIRFVSTKVVKTGEKTGMMTGDLTMLGVTKPVTLEVELIQVAPHPLPQYEGVVTAGFEARGTLRRTDWGMDTFAPLLGDEITMIIAVDAFKQ